MTPNLPLPTEQEIQAKAALMFPDSEEMRNSFIEGVWNTIYTMPEPKNND